MEEQIKSVMEFYAITHRLKTMIRTGWIKWRFDADRFESVAEHIYGTLMLAFAVNSQFSLGVDIEKVCIMLAFHELGETIIGDISAVETNARKNKHEREMEAVRTITNNLNDGQRILSIFTEYEERQSKESRFAYFIDKLECELQVKYYDEMGQVDVSIPREGEYEKIRQAGLAEGFKDLAHIWFEWDKRRYNFDELFTKLIDYVGDHRIFDKEER